MIDRITTTLTTIANEELDGIEYKLARVRETSEIDNSTRLVKARLTNAITNVSKAIMALNEVIEEYQKDRYGGLV